MDNKVKEEAELRKEADVADAVYDAETGKLHLKNEAGEDIAIAEGIASKEAVEKNTSDIVTNKENIEKIRRQSLPNGQNASRKYSV